MQACGEQPPTPVAVPLPASFEPIPAHALGARNGHVGALTYESGVRLRSPDPRLGRVVGVAVVEGLGLVMATKEGDWLTVPFVGGRLPERPTVTVTPMRDAPGAPGAQSNALRGWGGMLVSFPAEGRVVAYDPEWCGLAALPQPRFVMAPEQTVNAIALLMPEVWGRSPALFAGRRAGAPGQAISRMYTIEQPLTLSEPFTPGVPGHRLVGLAALETSAGCDALALWRPLRRPGTTEIRSFCSPEFSTTPNLLLGDVVVKGKRTAPPQNAHPILVRVPVPVKGAAPGHLGSLILVAQDDSGGPISVLTFSVPPARYEPVFKP